MNKLYEVFCIFESNTFTVEYFPYYHFSNKKQIYSQKFKIPSSRLNDNFLTAIPEELCPFCFRQQKAAFKDPFHQINDREKETPLIVFWIFFNFLSKSWINIFQKYFCLLLFCFILCHENKFIFLVILCII